MRATGFLTVACTFIAVALLVCALIRAMGWEVRYFSLSLVVAAIVASQVGTLIWHRQSPHSPERYVKLCLGVVLSVTAVAFTLIFQAVSGWLTYPEVMVPIAAVGGFAFPFAVVGPLWKALSQRKPPVRPQEPVNGSTPKPTEPP